MTPDRHLDGTRQDALQTKQTRVGAMLATYSLFFER